MWRCEVTICLGRRSSISELRAASKARGSFFSLRRRYQKLQTKVTHHNIRNLPTRQHVYVRTNVCHIDGGPCAWKDDGEFEKYAAADEEDEELDVGDVERDRFKFDHVPDSMMMPKELMDKTPGAAVEPPKKRASARKKAGTKA